MHSRWRLYLHRLAALFVGFVFIMPLLWMIVASLGKTGTAPPRAVLWLPTDPQWQNYRTIFDLAPLTQYAFNSLYVVLWATPLTLLTASWAGYGIARSDDASRRRLFVLAIVLLMIPGAAMWLFRFQIFRWLQLVNSLWALIVPAFAAGSPLFVLLYYWSFRQIPEEIYESAELDGAEVLRSWWQIALPLVKPTTIAVLILAAVLYWSDFIGPLLYLRQPSLYTLPVGMQIIKAMDATNWPLLMAAATVLTAPVLLLFLFLQRFFLNDISLTNLIER